MELSHIERCFFELLKSGLWNEPVDSTFFPLTPEDWNEIFLLSKKQALLGNAFDGVTTLLPELQPPMPVKLKWIAILQKIEQQNIQLNQYAAEVSQRFKKDGFRNVILKGQGIATFYPDPLHRQSGDIDIYLEGGREKVLSYLKQFGAGDEIVYHHIDFPTPKGEIECHTHCSWSNNPFMNRRLQRKFKEWTMQSFDNMIQVGEGAIPIPIAEMNQYYILHHIYRHLFGEGIGLRQLCDYAMLMDKTYTAESAGKLRSVLKELGLTNFAKAVFYILVTYLGYPKEKLPVTIDDDKFGPILFDEIMLAGNFGQYDSRLNIDYDSHWSKFYQRVKRNSIFLSYFPGEVIYTPFFKIWHFVWRKYKGYL